MNTAFKSVPLLICGYLLSGCAAHNHQFAASPVGSERINHLVQCLDHLKDVQGEEDVLYDVSFAPLGHNHLHVFAEVDEEGSPAVYVESEFQTCLPLFAFVKGSVSQYDEDQRLLTRNEFDASLWGAFREERETVATPVGHREKTHHTAFWLINWWDNERWHPNDDMSPDDFAD